MICMALKYFFFGLGVTKILTCLIGEVCCQIVQPSYRGHRISNVMVPIHCRSCIAITDEKSLNPRHSDMPLMVVTGATDTERCQFACLMAPVSARSQVRK